jgi:hypothetical protein
MSPARCSGSSLPCSMSCMQATAVNDLVIDSSQNTESGVMGAPVSALPRPALPSYTTPSDVHPIETAPSTVPASTADCSAASIGVNAVRLSICAMI